MTDTSKLPQPLDMTGGVEYRSIWQRYCGGCGWIIHKDQQSNICPECGKIDIHEREIVK